ncbi:MAG TPA: SDR family NAD(P)-dependent oxidoreductase [bacterium]|nr:SDR family NAD(P)-dependent oxidoreductase [bacterium]
MGLLDGKVAIVTGAGRGIGRAEAMLLAAEGAKVVVNDLGVELDGSGRDQSVAQKVADEIMAAGGDAVSNQESVSDHEAARLIVEQAISSFGRLDIVVNNAGITRDKMVYNMEEAMFDAVVAVHMKGTFNLGKWACRYFREKGEGGRIINTTSAAGLVGNVGQTNYGAAKAGIAAMTLIWAREMGKYSVTVNAIAPAARTRMTLAAFGDLTPEEGEFDAMAPENVAPLVAYLASAAAAEVTGQVIGVSAGDIEIFEPWKPIKSISKEGRWTVAELTEKMKEIV